MKLESDHYAYRIQWSDEDREWVALCIEFPGLSWLAASPETALRGARKVVAQTISDMENTGEDPPEEHRKLALEAAEQGVSLNRLVSARLAGARA